jgi:hypothetical protein
MTVLAEACRAQNACFMKGQPSRRRDNLWIVGDSYAGLPVESGRPAAPALEESRVIRSELISAMEGTFATYRQYDQVDCL